jgi:DNA-binding transcriptional MerR regulator
MSGRRVRIADARLGKKSMMTMMKARAGEAGTGEPVGGFARIGDVAREFGLTLRALRFYEDKGLIAPRREGNTRLYSQQDVARVRLVALGRKAGFSLREIKQLLDLHESAEGNARPLRALIEKSERQLVRLQKQRAEINEASEALQAAMDEWRAALARLQPVAATG